MLLIAISIAWVSGILIGSIYHLPLAGAITGLIPVPFVVLLKSHHRGFILISLCLTTFFIGAYYSSTDLPQKSPLAEMNDQGLIEIRGEITSQPEVRDKLTHIRLDVREINTGTGWHNIRGTALIYCPHYPQYQYHDILLVQGTLETPPLIDNFDYQAYLANQEIYSTMLNPKITLIERAVGFQPGLWIFEFREHLSQTLAAALPEPQASLAQGIILGIRNNIPQTLKTDLSVTGTAHLLAISGINLSIIAGIFITLGLRIFGRRYYLYIWPALLIIWFYALITGMQPPVVRSAIMASIFLLAELLGRQKSAFTALAFSAAIMIGISPPILWSISFQLSFLAMSGLILIAPLIQKAGRKFVAAVIGDDNSVAHVMTAITDSFSISLGSIIAVWPVIALNFGIVSLVGPLATFLITPVLIFIIITGSLTALAGLISPVMTQVIGWATWFFLSYMLWIVSTFASWQFTSLNVELMSRNFSWVYYSMLGLALYVQVNFKKLRTWAAIISSRLTPGLIKATERISLVSWKWTIIPLLVIAFLTSHTAATLPNQNLHVNFLDVGEGDAILIQTGNKNILVDGGPSLQAIGLGLGGKMPFWDRQIDMVILTHPHLDHLGGLIEVLKRYQVDRILTSSLVSDSSAYQEWSDIINTKNIPRTMACTGQQIDLGNNTLIEVVNTSNENSPDNEADLENDNLVLRLNRDKISFLFTADIGPEVENRLIDQRSNIGCTVLKVSHHGSAQSTSEEFLAVASPQIAVISVGADNLFGHPDNEVIDRLKQHAVSENHIYRTDLSGTIEFTTDGQNLWVKTDR